MIVDGMGVGINHFMGNALSLQAVAVYAMSTFMTWCIYSSSLASMTHFPLALHGSPCKSVMYNTTCWRSPLAVANVT